MVLELHGEVALVLLQQRPEVGRALALGQAHHGAVEAFALEDFQIFQAGGEDLEHRPVFLLFVPPVGGGGHGFDFQLAGDADQGVR